MHNNVIKIIVIYMLIMTGLFYLVLNTITSTIEENGGIKNIIVKAGKEVKDIQKQIDKE